MAAGRFKLLVQRRDLAQHDAVDTLHPAKVQDETAAALVVNQGEQLFADDLNSPFLQQAGNLEARDSDVAPVLDSEAMMVEVGHGKSPPQDGQEWNERCNA